MNKLSVYCMIAVLLSGCMMALEEEASVTAPQENEPKVMTRRFISLRQIHNGMTQKEVESVLAQQVIIGYEIIDENSEQYLPVTLTNPYRSETFTSDAKEYAVDYYIAGVKEADGNISDEELIPLIFYNKKLIGTGWDFLAKKKGP